MEHGHQDEAGVEIADGWLEGEQLDERAAARRWAHLRAPPTCRPPCMSESRSTSRARSSSPAARAIAARNHGEGPQPGGNRPARRRSQASRSEFTATRQGRRARGRPARVPPARLQLADVGQPEEHDDEDEAVETLVGEHEEQTGRADRDRPVGDDEPAVAVRSGDRAPAMPGCRRPSGSPGGG